MSKYRAEIEVHDVDRLLRRKKSETDELLALRRGILIYGTKWGAIAEKLASAQVGSTFYVKDPDVEPKILARQIRNGLHGHKCCTLVRRSVRVKGDCVAVKKVGYWPRLL